MNPLIIVGVVLLVVGALLLAVGITFAVLQTPNGPTLIGPVEGQVILAGGTAIEPVAVAIPYAIRPEALSVTGYSVTISTAVTYPNIQYIFQETLFPALSVNLANNISQSIVWYQYGTGTITFYFPTVLSNGRTFVTTGDTTAGDIVVGSSGVV